MAYDRKRSKKKGTAIPGRKRQLGKGAFATKRVRPPKPTKRQRMKQIPYKKKRLKEPTFEQDMLGPRF